MSSRSNFIKFALSVVLFMLVLIAAFSFISAYPAAAIENQPDNRIAELEQQIQQLLQTNAQQAQMIEQLQAEAGKNYILVLRHEDVVLPSLFGDSITVNSRIQEISVSKAMFDSCQEEQDITNTELHQLLASGSISQTRVIVVGKHIR